MSLILAVEPDSAQADVLRRLAAQHAGAQLIVVTSAYAAVTTMNRRVPDLVILSTSLGPKAQEVIDRFRAVSGVPNPEILQIPATILRPDALGAQIGTLLTRAAANREKAASSLTPMPTPPPLVRPGSPPPAGVVAWSPDAPVDAEVHYAELALVQAQAEARLAAELERLRRDAAEQHASELARLQEEADAKRHAEVAQARAAAATGATDALTAEIAKARADAEQQLHAELERVRAEAAERLATQLAEADTERAHAIEQARAAAERAGVAAEAAAARAVQAEVARIREESDAKLEAELALAREEAAGARQAQQQAQAQLAAIRDAAARDARAAAEEAAARELEAEVGRAQAEAEARLQDELARVRAEAERTRDALQQAQVDAAAARDVAAGEARAAAEAAAAREYDARVERLQAEAEARLREVLERVREETDRARQAGQSEMELVRQQAEREARERAQAAVGAEIERARAEADARLAAEVAAIRQDAERRRTTELAAIQAELELARDAAREIAHSAAAGAISAGVARAEISIPKATARVTAAAAARLASMAFSGAAGTLRVSSVVARTVWERLPARMVPVAAGLVVVGVAALLIDVRGAAVTGFASVGRTLAPVARSAKTTATNVADTATGRVRALVAESGLEARRTEAPLTRPSPGQRGTTPEMQSAEPPPGVLVVFGRVPFDLYIGARRIGSTEDGQMVMKPGRYRVAIVNRRLNYRGDVVLEVRSGDVTAHTVRLPDGLLAVETEPGAEVWVEGERAGVAPLGALSVPIGTREVVVRHPDLGERRTVVEVRYGETAHATLLRSP